ncbi:MAG: hypothetical protein HY921_12250 [Elusimicrobia bacterium]|nr:hypothetical protein [Elusimicrobiota bacterium]
MARSISRHALAASLALAFCLAGTASAEQFTAPATEDACKNEVRDPAWTKVQCLNAYAGGKIFKKLLAGSGLPQGELLLYFLTHKNEINAKYIESLKEIRINGGLLRLPSKALIAAISHEMGHWIQNTVLFKGELIDDDFGYSPWSDKKVEGHADWLGARLAVRAGYKPRDWILGAIILFGCAKNIEKEGRTHPSLKNRFVNLMSKEAKLRSWVRGDYELTHPKPFVIGESPDMFDQHGAIPRARPLSALEVRQRCSEYSYAWLAEEKEFLDLTASSLEALEEMPVAEKNCLAHDERNGAY